MPIVLERSALKPNSRLKGSALSCLRVPGAPSPVQNLLFMMLGAFDSDDDDAPPLADLPSLIISETSEVSFTVPVGVSTAAFLDGLRVVVCVETTSCAVVEVEACKQ